ncbi:hypothetical protein DRN87_04070 [Candidatus Geothermarchaeota archaeon]|nr:MAG: hypothetical protein DRN87_04070 [Candidatus Geothermarchaeota archaeon]
MLRRKLDIRSVLKRYNELYRKLYIYRNALSVQISKINNRLKGLEDRARWYKEKGDIDTAYLYAREYKSLYIVREVLWHIKLNIEGVLGRIDTIKTLIAPFEDLDVTLKTLDQVLKDSKVIYSMFSNISSELLSAYTDLQSTLTSPDIDLSYITVPVEDAKAILENIERKVGMELIKKFPNIPRNLDEVFKEGLESGITKLYNVVATDGGNATQILRRMDNEELVGRVHVKLDIDAIKKIKFKDLSKDERQVLTYLLRSGRKDSIYINIYNLARLLRKTPLQILDSLYSLSDQGLIVFN